ncbi:DUF4893 domain-containing protein [Devosia sp. PTR5]|uniref:DUF4893 domain-containing protein n=1 Tax=Devosia oryzisoli TaxID=2774138 RepID=A0A927FYM8_9HYPH|nr:DUF4893 domain-containing protein [Devosia oryzisoli]MBD8066501.1 DUF4893 domain-containing protein [Devosia oryzisoli]
MPPTLRICTLALAGMMAMPLQALAAGCFVPKSVSISDSDRDRLEQSASTTARALGEALLSTSPDDRAILARLFASGVETTDAISEGTYRCRTLKLGGLLPLTVYGFFQCRISDGGRTIEKLTGSQRFSGALTPGGDGLTYVGSLHYGDEQPGRYGADEERNQVGCLHRISGDVPRYRLDLPQPRFESTMDVIEIEANH